MTNSPHKPEFIEEMKQKLLAEKEQLQEELARIAHKDHGDYQADFPDYGRNDEENASEITEYTNLFATAEALEERLESVNAAIMRIEAGIYGITDKGEIIPEGRLRANPAATTLVKRDAA